MDRRRVNEVLAQVVDRLKVTYQPERIVLFGSWAYGAPSADSDVDVLIVKRTSQPFHRRWADVYRLVRSGVKGVDFSPFVLTPEEVARRQRARDPFIEEVMTRGETLYAASG